MKMNEVSQNLIFEALPVFGFHLLAGFVCF